MHVDCISNLWRWRWRAVWHPEQMLYALLAARPEEANAVHKRASGVDELNCLNKAGGCKRSEEGTFLNGHCWGDHLDFPRQPSSRCTFSVPGGLECQGCIHRGRGVCNDKCSRAEAGGALAPHQTMPPLAHQGWTLLAISCFRNGFVFVFVFQVVFVFVNGSLNTSQCWALLALTRWANACFFMVLSFFLSLSMVS